MEITKGELKLISRLLELAGNEFSNHGCNDMDQALWDEIGFTPEDRATLIHEMQLWNGDTEYPYPTKLINVRDDMVMNFYAAKLKDGNLAGSPAPTPPLDVEAEKRITEIRERESKATTGPYTINGGGYLGIIAVVDGKNSQIGRAEACGDRLSDEQVEDNARFFAHARLDIPFLLEQISRRHIASPAPQSSRTYGDLPGSIRNMVVPHEWDNKNISEQRDYALDMVEFLERELGNFRRNQAHAASPAQPEKPWIEEFLEHVQWLHDHAENRIKQVHDSGILKGSSCIPADSQLNAYLQGERDVCTELLARAREFKKAAQPEKRDA